MVITSREVSFVAPVSGLLTPVEQTPDPVFAQKMVGDGIAVLPSDNVLVAPCDGVITQLHACCHALTLTSEDGLEIVLHIGVDTVELQGRGFQAKVVHGTVVKRGDALVIFDLELIGRECKSALCIMVITNGEMLAGLEKAEGRVQAGSSRVMLARLKAGGPEKLSVTGGNEIQSPAVRITHRTGLHARPAAVVAEAARRFSSDIRLVKNDKDDKEANAKSLVSILKLDVRRDDTIAIRAAGTDADEALRCLLAVLAEGDAFFEQEAAPEAANAANSRKGDASTFHGLPVSPGQAQGVTHRLRRSVPEFPKQGRGLQKESEALKAALRKACSDLDQLRQRMASMAEQGDADRAAIFGAHAGLLEDPELLQAAEHGLQAGQSAPYAWSQAFEAQARALASLENPLLASRASDVRDVGQRVLALLCGQTGTSPEPPLHAIILCDDLTPSEVAGLKTGSVAGICAVTGGPTSHAAIVARSRNIPFIAAIEARALETPDGTPALIDGDSGALRLNPDAEEILRAREAQDERTKKRDHALRNAAEPAVTRDGRRIQVLGNIDGVNEAWEVVQNGGEGVGLLRSEFLFLNRSAPPDEAEQTEAYRAIARTLGPERTLLARTLDIGGDKPIAYLPVPAETNPFLGLRGIRLSLLDDKLFAVQIRSILAASSQTGLSIMFPMVSSVEEFRAARALVEAEKAALGITAPVETGMMVEVPSAALLAENLASEVDFFSIGTNDLAQYTLAVDRGHARLAHMADPLHPAVLRLVKATVQGAHKWGKKVSVCGDMASDPVAVPVLLGLGVDALSVPACNIPMVKSAIRAESMERCRILAADVLDMLTAADVRRYIAMLDQ